MLSLSVPSCVHLSVATPQAYSPLAKAQKLQDPTVGSIAQRLGVTPAQVLIRWAAAVFNAVHRSTECHVAVVGAEQL